jgi:hypothetical protein
VAARAGRGQALRRRLHLVQTGSAFLTESPPPLWQSASRDHGS